MVQKRKIRAYSVCRVAFGESLEDRCLMTGGLNINIPVAVNGSLNIKPGEQAFGSALATDADGDPLTYELVSAPRPEMGSVLFNADGNFTVTAAREATDEFTFTFSANDGKLYSNPATITVTVIGTNLPPVANGANVSVQPFGTFSGYLTGMDPEGLPLTFSLVAAPPPGTGSVFVNPEGSFAFMANVPGFTGPTTFTVTASDGVLTSPPATITVTVGSVVPPTVNVGIPTADNSSIIVSAGQSGSGKVTASDPEGQPLTFTLTTASPPGTGTVLFNSNGSFTYTADVPGFSGPTTFTFTASDGGGLTSPPATVTVTVNPSGVFVPTGSVDPAVALSGVQGTVYRKHSTASPLDASAKLTNVPPGADLTKATILAVFTTGAVKNDTFKVLAISGLKVSSSSIKDGRTTIAKIKLRTKKVPDAITGKTVTTKMVTVTFLAGTEDLVNRVLQAIAALNKKPANSTRTVTFTVNGKRADQTFFGATGTKNAVSQ